jgi:hypothetical protein
VPLNFSIKAAMPCLGLEEAIAARVRLEGDGGPCDTICAVAHRG